MAFLPKKGYDGKTERVQVAAVTFTKGDCMVYNDAGYLSRAAAGAGDTVYFVAAETISTAATAGDYLLAWRTGPDVLFEADTVTDPTRTQLTTAVDLSSASLLDTSAYADVLFQVIEIVGAATDRKVLGYFQHATPNT